jgi:hypothetical protein
VRRQRHRGFPTSLALGALAVVFVSNALAAASRSLGPASIPIWLAVVAGVVFLARGPLGEGVLHALADRGTRDDEPAPEVVHELDDLRARVAELEERVDFSERLLAQARERAEVRPGETA